MRQRILCFQYMYLSHWQQRTHLFVAKRVKIFALGLVAALLLSPLSALGTEPQVQTEEPAKPVELHDLSNEDLLQQAQTIFQQASGTFLAQIRGVLRKQVLLVQARRGTLGIVIPPQEAPRPEDKPEALKLARLNVEHTQARHEALIRQAESRQQEQVCQEALIEQIDAALVSSKTFNEALKKLDMLALEVSWRIADGTLSPDGAPELLNRQYLTQQRQQLADRQTELTEQAATARAVLETLLTRIEKAQQDVIEANVHYTSAQEKYAQESKRQTMEQEYLDQAPERLLAQLPTLQDERIWLNGTYDLSYRRVMSAKTRIGKIQRRLDRLTPPDAAKILEAQTVVRAEDTQEAAGVVEEMIAYDTERIEILRELHPALQALVQQTDVFVGDGAVLTQHLFRMQVIAKILERAINEGALSQDMLPKETQTERLGAASDTLVEQISTAQSDSQQAQEQMTKIATQIEDAQHSRNELQIKLSSLKKIYEVALKTQEWEEAIKNLNAQQIVEKFQQNTEALTQGLQNVQQKRQAFEDAQAVVEDAKRKFALLHDPMWKTVQEEVSQEKDALLKSLYEFAGLELPLEETPSGAESAQAAAASSDAVPETVPSASAQNTPEQPATSESAPEEVAAFDLDIYQTLLSNRVNVVDDRESRRTELLGALQTLSQQLKQYMGALEEADSYAQQHQANAVELKKRIGRKQLSVDEVPDGITEALNDELITEIETTMAELLTQQTQIQHDLEELEHTDETIQATQTVLNEIITLTGKRSDRLNEQQKLQQDVELTQTELNDTDLKMLQQTALRRLEAEQASSEYLLRFVPSPRADELNELLHTYYLEMLELESRQSNLDDQTQKIEAIIRNAEEEQIIVEQLIPLLQQRVQLAETNYNEKLAKIQIQLVPEKAEDILRKFEATTGRQLSMPTPIPEEEKAAAIITALERLLEQRMQVATAEKWLALFEERHSPSGIGKEIGSYQETMGAIMAKNARFQRRMRQILGHSQKEFAELDPDEVPQTELDKRRFLEGEIGVLQADRKEAREQAAILVPAKLLGILLIALILSWSTGRVIQGMIRRDERNKSKDVHMAGVLSLTGTILKFFIWIAAIISGLSHLGFDVGAILAGLGIGGLAIAMASKETVGNIIGGINILMNKPFKIGDYVIFEGRWCSIEDIGLRYTRLNEFKTKFLLIVPNSKLSETTVINTNADHRIYRHNLMVPVSIRNSYEKVELAMRLINEYFDSYPDATLKQAIPTKFDNYSFGIKVRYDVHEVDEYVKAFYDIHKGIIRLFQENHIEFADKPYFNVAGGEDVEPFGD